MSHRDRELGLDRDITRRDFVYGSSLLMGGALVGCGADRGGRESGMGTGARPEAGDFAVGDDWYGPGGVGDYAASHGNTPGLVQAAHEIRSGRFDAAPADAIDTAETYDLVVVGAGFAGLAAAHHFRRLRPDDTVLILDNHPIFGGEAKRNDFLVDGVRVSGPQGSNDFALGAATGGPEDTFSALGITRDLRYAEPTGSAQGMRIPTDNFAFMHWQHDLVDVGHFFPGTASPWIRDLWNTGLDSSPWSAAERQAMRRARTIDALDHAPEASDLQAWLDSMSMRQYYEDVLGLPAAVGDYIDPILASIIGLGSDAISAWWGRHFSLPGFTPVSPRTDTTYHSFPGGNAGIARHFVKALVADAIEGSNELGDVLFGRVDFDRFDADTTAVRMRLESTVVRVEHEGPAGAAERVRVTYTHAGRPYVVRGRRVVVAAGGWVVNRVVRDLPAAHQQAYASFAHAPVLVANVALNNWRFLERLGVSAAIWPGRSAMEPEPRSFGFSCNIRRPMIVPGLDPEPLDPERPTVMTFYAPFYAPGLSSRDQGVVGRTQVLGTSFAEYERRIREQMTELFAAGGFDARRDIAGLILNRWGHAYVAPGPGFMSGTAGAPAPADALREPFGRIAIGHSELRGHQNWTGATAEGRRAVDALLAG